MYSIHICIALCILLRILISLIPGVQHHYILEKGRYSELLPANTLSFVRVLSKYAYEWPVFGAFAYIIWKWSWWSNSERKKQQQQHIITITFIYTRIYMYLCIYHAFQFDGFQTTRAKKETSDADRFAQNVMLLFCYLSSCKYIYEWLQSLRYAYERCCGRPLFSLSVFISLVRAFYLLRITNITK